MYSDFITFFKSLPFHAAGAKDILPESIRDLIPMDSLSSLMAEMNDSMKILGASVTLIIALLACFFGYKFAKAFMSLTGFLAGVIIGLTISWQILKLGTPLILLSTLFGGIILSVFAFRVYTAGIFILCFILAFIAAAALLPFAGDIQFFLSTLTGFVIGSLSVKYIRPVIILLSAVVGGSTAAGLITSLCEHMHVYTFSKFSSGGLTLIICLLGILIQFLTTSDKDEEKRRQKREKKKQAKKERKNK